MKIKTILCTLCAATVLGSCSYDDGGLWDAVNKQEERISALEKWQKTVVEQLNSLQGIVTASDYVTSVEKIDKDGKQGYKFSFLHAAPITLYYNENSEVSGSSSIGVAQDENGYYWTMNGEPLLVEGKPVPVTGGGGASLTPNKENPERYDLTIGETTITVDPNVVGAHPIKEVTEENGLITITLNDNTTKVLPKYVDLKTYLNSEYTDVANAQKSYPIALPEGCIVRKLDENPSGWTIAVTGTGATTALQVTYAASGEATVAFVISDGNALTVIQEVTFKVTATAGITWTAVAYNGSAITIPSGVTDIKVTGTPANKDVFNSDIMNPLVTANVVNLDLSEVVMSDFPLPANAFSNCTTLETVILPSTNKNMFKVFENCTNLKSVTITSTVLEQNPTTNQCGSWFVGCSALEHVYVPADKVDTYKSWWATKSVSWLDLIAAIPVD